MSPALPQDPGSLLSTYIGTQDCLVNLVLGDPMPSSGLLGYQVCTWRMALHVVRHPYTSKKKQPKH